MKAIRTYRIEEDAHLIQKTVFLPDEDSLDDPKEISVVGCIDPDGVPYLEDYPAVKLSVHNTDVSLDLEIQETVHFLNLLKFMYYGS